MRSRTTISAMSGTTSQATLRTLFVGQQLDDSTGDAVDLLVTQLQLVGHHSLLFGRRRGIVLDHDGDRRRAREALAALRLGRLDATLQLVAFERLSQMAVGTARLRRSLVERFQVTDQQDDRNVRRPRLHPSTDLVAARAGHVHVGQHDVRHHVVDRAQRLVAVSDGDDLDLRVVEIGQADDLLDRGPVVCQEQSSHGRGRLSRRRAAP